MDRETHRELRARLRLSWNPFFGRFGSLRPVQVEAIPAILRGESVVVAAPTACGKTEAVVAPVAELLSEDYRPGIGLLYVVPTRALANDMLRRLESPLLDMGLSAALKHGDHPRLPSELPQVLITTPESLDSLICRRAPALGSVRYVILDEIHLVDATYRGDQLRTLLRRLLALPSEVALRTYLLSATMRAPEEVASRYVNPFELVRLEGARSIEAEYVTDVQSLVSFAKRRRFRKVLCFCNKREKVEEVAEAVVELWDPYPVVAHHGSLGRGERQEAEEVMRESPIAFCVSTSTLEIGIDIGDIDLVAIAELPWNLSSLAQRIGRASRQADRIDVAVIAPDGQTRMFAAAMLEAIELGILEDQAYEPDLSVAVQQIFSMLFGDPPGVPESVLANMLSDLAAPDIVARVLHHLADEGWILRRGGVWAAETRLMDLGERGRIHSNIPDTRMHKVVNVETGSEVGEVSGTPDKKFVLARRAWEILRVRDGVVEVRAVKGRAKPAMFERRRDSGAWTWLLPEELRS